ncbi:hypothetical protein NLJ89_g516 [Agrocybe chaxingu]|uniref:Uncharacterized protein n=1 Tax=Agrocybe chaxingu TaxID=84603 RepID=A0A9W8N1P3_9AGAR|nr:hypothetical protein NLJ89_g516 [Agrocybe chaxingu]
MLLKFTSSDMLNTSLIDVATGERAYNIATALDSSEQITYEQAPLSSISSSFSSPERAPSGESLTSTVASSSPALQKKVSSEPEGTPKGDRRQTTVTDATGNVVAEITWNGRRPDITITDEKVGALTDLFGSSTIRFMPKILAIPTRFDTEYIWTATADTLTLFDYDSETVKGTFHQNVIRIPTSSKTSKFMLSSPTKSKPFSPSKPYLASSPSLSSSSSSSSDQSDAESKPLAKSAFIPTHLPGVGSNYLEFVSHPLAHDVEIILSFLMMEILRRGRFNLTPYTFEKPKLWQLKEARALILRRFRRNTV